MSYNGWSNYETWNVVLWIRNDETLYHTANGCADYDEFIEIQREWNSLETPDKVAWNDSGIDRDEVNEACFTKEEESDE